MFGQIENHHTKNHRITPKSASVKYTGEIWTKNNGILMEILHLASASTLITPFLEETKTATLLNYEPTLSPRDPNFDSWYKDYQAKMSKTQRAPGGSEPGE